MFQLKTTCSNSLVLAKVVGFITTLKKVVVFITTLKKVVNI